MRPLLALFIRSLREDVRHRGTYILRTMLVVLILFFLWITHQRVRWSGAVGREFFTSVLWIDLFILCVVGLSYFASAIAEEKDDDTLGLLRMTDLNALAILLGKSTGRMLGALLLIAAQLPFMLVAVTMGGLDARQVLAGFALLLAFAFHLANLALIGSVLCARTSTAAGFTGVLLAGFVFAPGVLKLDDYALAHYGEPLARFCQGWIDATPIARLREITTTGFHGSPLGLHFVVNVALGFVWFGVAWALFERWAERGGEAGTPATVNPAATMRVDRCGRPRKHALRWKDYHFLAGGIGATVIKTVIALLLLSFPLSALSRRSSVGTDQVAFLGGVLFGVASIVLVLSLAVDASRIFKHERRDQTLSGLALLPCSIGRVVWEKVRGCFATNWPLIAMMALGLALLAPEALPELGRDWVRRPKSIFVGGAVVLCLTISALQLPLTIAWLSLRVRWGGFPIGLTLWFLGNQAAVMFCFALFREAALFMLPLAGLVVAGYLAFDIPRRLEQLAADE